MPFQILHEIPPTSAIPWDIVTFVGDIPIHIDVSTMITPEQRESFLQVALAAAAHRPILIYTGIPTSDHDSPCGCTGYDGVCDYHRHSEYEVAECYCSRKYNTACTYHQMVRGDLPERISNREG